MIAGGGGALSLWLLTLALRSPTGVAPIQLVWLAAAVLGEIAATYTSARLANDLSEDNVRALRLRLSQGILGAPLEELEGRGSASLLGTLTDDVGELNKAAVLLPNTIHGTTQVVGILGYLGWLSFSALATTAISGLTIAGIFTLLMRRATPSISKAREQTDEMYIHFGSLVNGIKELKLHHGRRDHFQNVAFRNAVEDVRSASIKSFRQVVLAICAGLFGLKTMPVVLLATAVLSGSTDTALLAGCVTAAIYLAQPMVDIMNLFPTLERARFALKRVERLGVLLEKVDNTAPLVEATLRAAKWRSVSLVGATYSYRAEGSVFEVGPVTLTIAPGEVVFLVGGNGSGKTTLAKMLAGLYIPQRGQLVHDGVLVTAHNREAYREMFSAVFSDFHLFRHIEAPPGVSVQEEAKRQLTLFELETKVGTHAGEWTRTELSRGQSKRLALVAALIEDRPIYILDEWAADQEPSFRRRFYTEVLPALRAQGKTVIAVTHDDAYFHLADRIVTLDYGKIVSMTDGRGNRMASLS